MPVVCYTDGIVDWTLQECAELDRFTTKQMTLFKALHPHADIDRLYVNHKMGGTGLLSIADVVHLEKHSLSVYVNKSKKLIIAKVRDHLLRNVGSDTISKSTILSNYVEQWRSKALHG